MKLPESLPEESQEEKMDNINTTRGVGEASVQASAKVQSDRFAQREQIQADSVVKNLAVYLSPVIKIDPDTSATIIQYRDAQTGKVTNQYPSENAIKSYQQTDQSARDSAAAARLAADKAPAPVAAKPAPAKEPVKSDVVDASANLDTQV